MKVKTQPGAAQGEPAIRTAMGVEDVVNVYGRWAPVYDLVFGPLLESSRKAAVACLGPTVTHVLEVGVGTGISLANYPRHARVTGIDLSPDMLARARRRVSRGGLENVDALLEMDASELAFPDNSFDAAMAMYVMTVLPDPARAMAQMRRVVKPGGRVFAVGHFAPERGLRQAIAGALASSGRRLGWNTTVTVSALAALPGIRLLANRPAGLGGFYRLLEFEVVK
jgi:phosphatidylethanolamine/phosphatidyl-N-methylethanolamine N-methyltransferase